MKKQMGLILMLGILVAPLQAVERKSAFDIFATTCKGLAGIYLTTAGAYEFYRVFKGLRNSDGVWAIYAPILYLYFAMQRQLLLCWAYRQYRK